MLSLPALKEIHQRMKVLAGAVHLPLRSGQWRGEAGSVLGEGTGSSIDFQDQRAYQPGDDPRHINWQATARTGNYTMKLYRREVSPRVDLLFDVSLSMYLTEEKERRAWELCYLCLEGAMRLGGSPRLHVLGASAPEWPVERALAYDWPEAEKAPASFAEQIGRIPLRTGALRVLLSDLLHPGSPEQVLARLVTGKGRAILFAPYCREEATPDWLGNIDFEDCEFAQRDRRRVEPAVLERYHRAYETHFGLWRQQCAKFSAALARVPSAGDCLSALRQEAVRQGCLEIQA